jgi:hypothetical protein
MAKSKAIYIFLLMIFFMGLTIFSFWRLAHYARVVEETIAYFQQWPAIAGPAASLDPEVMMTQNQNMTGDVFIGQLAQRIEKNLKNGLTAYVTDYQDLRIDMAPFASEEIRQGYFKNLRIAVRQGKIKYPEYTAMGVPFDSVDCSFQELVMDLEQLKQGRIAPAGLASVVVHEIVLDEQALNEALRNASGKERLLRVSFQENNIQVQWTGKPQMEAEISLQIVTHKTALDSDQLLAEVRNLKINGLPVPQGIGRRFTDQINPLLPFKAFNSRVLLGSVHCGQGQLRIGLEDNQ